jgi:hypothetical protein
MRRRINVRAVRYISLKFHYFSNFASIVQLVPTYRTNISTLSRSCSIDLFTLFRESDTGIFVSFSVSETTCTESLMNGFEDGAVGGEVGLFDEDESTGQR